MAGSGSRIQRGFRRLGLVVAVPCFLVAVGCGGLASVNWVRTPTAGPWDEFPLAKPNLFSCLDKGGTPTNEECEREYVAQKADYDAYQKRAEMTRTRWEIVIFGVVLALGGLAWLAGCWAMGWVLAGFAKES